MNGKVAKRLRKKFDYKPYQARKYRTTERGDWRGENIVNIGNRQEYQDAKKDLRG